MLYPRQHETLLRIGEVLEATGRYPTAMELRIGGCLGSGKKISRQRVYQSLRDLKKAGAIDYEEGDLSTLALTEMGKAYIKLNAKGETG
jgi:DNA-binding PadR family transcriptional regulator